jgi:hypothetical protein
VIGCMCRRNVGAIQNYHAGTSRPLLCLYTYSSKPIKQEPALDNEHLSLPLSPPTLYEQTKSSNCVCVRKRVLKLEPKPKLRLKLTLYL